MSKIVFISGATSGIGEACAMKFAGEGHTLIISGRREERLKQLAEVIKTKFNVEVKYLRFDIRFEEQVVKAVESLKGSKWEKIEILINNAGLSLDLSPINEGLTQDWDTMIDTNIKGLLYLSKMIMPIMVENKSGHIINIGSIAGREVYPNGNVYCATKHAVAAITEAMRADLLPYGIKVSQVSPGATDTEFSLVRFKGDKKKAEKVYEGFKPLSGHDIAEVVFFSASLPEHVNINDVLVMPKAQASAININRKK